MKNMLFLLVALLISGCSKDGGTPSDSGSGGQGGSMARFTISGDYLYTVDHRTLKTFDISKKEHPVYTKNKDQLLEFGIETIFTMDTLLFIGSQNGMYLYDISNPGYPQYLSKALHITSCDPVVASGKFAYVTLNSENLWCGRTSNLLQIYDISDPYKPLLVNEIIGFASPRGLGVDGDQLFICDRGLKVYDISDPTKPKWTDDLTHIPEASDIDAYDIIPVNGALLLTGSDGIYQFDYSGEKLAFISKIEVVKK